MSEEFPGWSLMHTDGHFNPAPVKRRIVSTNALSFNKFESPHIHFLHADNKRPSQREKGHEYQVEIRWWSKLRSFFPFPPIWPSNPQSSVLWSPDSTHQTPLKMSLSSENGCMQKSIKGFNVVGLPWLPRLLSVIHRVTLFHSFLIVSARQKTGRNHYV